MIDDDTMVFAVTHTAAGECLAALEKARFEFECLLDYMAANFRDALPVEFLDESIAAMFEAGERHDIPTFAG